MAKKRERTAYNRQWRATHTQHLAEYEKKRRVHKRVINRKWVSKNRAYIKQKNVEYRAKHGEALRAYDRARPNEMVRRARHASIRKNTRLEVLEAYGGKCVCCGEHYPELLNIDHIRGDGGVHRKESGCAGSYGIYVWLKRHGYPRENFQVLCFNCNLAKSRYGQCPHQAGRSLLEYYIRQQPASKVMRPLREFQEAG